MMAWGVMHTDEQRLCPSSVALTVQRTRGRVRASHAFRCSGVHTSHNTISAAMSVSVVPPAVTGALIQLRDALLRAGVKAPWQLTGSWNNPDFLHFLPSGHEYRKVAPGSQPIKPKVPHDHPRLVYDIKYHVRDYRRNSKWTTRTVDAKPFDFNALYAAAPLKPEDVKTVPIPPTMPTHGF